MPYEDPFYHSDYSTKQLDVDSLIEVFYHYVQMSPIHQTVALRSTNWQIRRAIDYALFKLTRLSFEINWHEDRIAHPEPQLFIQGSHIRNLDKALECLDFILDNARIITDLSINIGINNAAKYLNPILEKFLTRENVQLEVLKIRRRYVGESYPIIADLICEHTETLRIVGKIGLTEAAASFTDKLNLERLSLMNFDLVEDGDMESSLLQEKTRYYMSQLSERGATFEHLSYTTYCGFEFARSQLRLLQDSEVKSLRLTMQKGNPVPFTDRLLLKSLQRLEFVGDMDISSHNFEKQFPHLNHFEFDRQNLACAG